MLIFHLRLHLAWFWFKFYSSWIKWDRELNLFNNFRSLFRRFILNKIWHLSPSNSWGFVFISKVFDLNSCKFYYLSPTDYCKKGLGQTSFQSLLPKMDFQVYLLRKDFLAERIITHWISTVELNFFNQEFCRIYLCF